MSPAEARIALLAAQLRADWDAVGTNRDKALSVSPSTGAPEAALVAMSLHHAYQAFESLLIRLARALDLPAPTGERSHQEILDAACLEIPGVRQPVVPAPARRAWQELLRFRHFLRHAYAAELDPDELRRNAARLDEAVGLTAPSVEAIVTSLLSD